MKYYLGVDAGGSKTYALVTDQYGNVLGMGEAGNGNHQTGYDIARRNIGQAVDTALHIAALTPDEIEHACFGLAGADRETDFKVLRPMIAALGFPRHSIVCDTQIALRAGTTRPYGVVLICGSGTNSAGRNRQGDFFQCGGFSYLFGDFGGGGALSVEVFRSVIRAWDGREIPTMLTGLLLEVLQYNNVDEMLDDYLDHNLTPPIHIAKLAFEAAMKGDKVAQDILTHQGEELGKSACAVIRRLGMEGETFDLVLAGSIVTRGEGDFIHAPIAAAVKRVAPGVNLVKLAVEPVVGAVWMALESSGEALSPEAYSQLKTIQEFHSITMTKRV